MKQRGAVALIVLGEEMFGGGSWIATTEGVPGGQALRWGEVRW